jgi:ribose-phosphate pyrophosphokinase
VTVDTLHYFEDSRKLASQVARKLGVASARVDVHRFPDRESLVRVAGPAGRRVVLLRHLHDPNGKLFEVQLAADALRRHGARRITLLVPYMPYMRQDRVFHEGEALSQHVLAQTLGHAVDKVVTLEPHLHRIRALGEVFPCTTRALPAASLLAGWCSKGPGRALLVGPDAESEPWVRALARLCGLDWVVGRKERLGDSRVRIELPDVSGHRRAILVDDIASSGTTLAAAARALRAGGISRVDAAVVHAIFAPGAERRIRLAGVERVVTCDTIPHATNAIATAPLFAEALGAPRRNS